MIEIPFITCFVLILFAGLYDLKTSDVHAEVPALLISFGLFYWFLFSLIHNNFTYFFNSVSAGLIFLLVGFLFYKAKIWGDGDAWILGGIGFLVPFLGNTFIPYPLSFIFNLLIVGGIYSLFYILIYGLLNKNVRKNFILEFKKYYAIYFGFIFTCFFISLYLPFFFLIGFLPPIYIYAKIVEKGMKKKVKTLDLKEGDVLAKGDIIGITKEDIKKLMAEKRFVEIQEGVRFTIVFPITLVFLYFYGGFFVLLLV